MNLDTDPRLTRLFLPRSLTPESVSPSSEVVVGRTEAEESLKRLYIF